MSKMVNREAKKLGSFGFELGSFFGKVAVFGTKMREIGFVLHKNFSLINHE
jgi:hypothetical protein